jgi:pimeloyl-ACP methyl ester carboxylesterase
LIGYEGSPRWPAGTPLDLDAECRALYPVLPCCASPYHLVGHSYGGVVALHLALASPTRVRTLTIIEPVFFQALRHTGDLESFDQFCRIRDDFIEALARGEREPAIARFIDFWTGDGAWERMPLAVRDATLKIADKIVLDWRASFAANPNLDRLAALGPRTLLLCGDRSPKPMQRLVDALNHLMPGSERAVISGADHLLPLSHTQVVTNAIISQLHADAERRAR